MPAFIVLQSVPIRPAPTPRLASTLASASSTPVLALSPASSPGGRSAGNAARPDARRAATADESAAVAALPSPYAELGAAYETVVVWFRDDLRLHDHAALTAAVRRRAAVAALAVTPSHVSPARRAALVALRAALREQHGVQLVVRAAGASGGEVAAAVAGFCAERRAVRLLAHRAVRPERRVPEKKVAAHAARVGLHVDWLWDGLLHTPDRLPVPLARLPDNCDAFAALVAAHAVDTPVPPPHTVLAAPHAGDEGALPAAHDAAPHVRGGEAVALAALADFVLGKSVVADRGRQRDAKSSAIATKFSTLGAFLDVGCLSARRVWHEVGERASPCSVRRFCAELDLMLRDFVALVTLKNGMYPA